MVVLMKLIEGMVEREFEVEFLLIEFLKWFGKLIYFLLFFLDDSVHLLNE